MRRMISKRIISSAKFLQMPLEAQALYFHLTVNADDDGIAEAYPITKLLGTTPDVIKILLAKEFIRQLNEDQVILINNWTEHNTIRTDRKVNSIYKNLLPKDVKYIEAKPRSDVRNNSKRIGGRSTDGISKGKLSKVNKIMSANADEQKNKISNSTANEIINSMDSSLGQPEKIPEIFDYDKYLDKMEKDKRRHIQIIRLFFLARNRKYLNLKQLAAAMNRNFKSAKTLIGYSDKQIQDTMLWLDTKFNSEETRWTLETVGKYIDDLKVQSKSRIITR